MMETIKTTIYSFHGLAAFHIQKQVIIKLTLLALQNTVLISQLLFLSTLAFELEYAAVFLKTRSLILADQGFVIHDLLPKNIPEFTSISTWQAPVYQRGSSLFMESI